MKLYIKSITMIILIILFIFTYSGYTQINTGDALILSLKMQQVKI